VVGKAVVYLDRAYDELVTVFPEAGNPSPEWARVRVAAGARMVGVLETSKALVLQSPDEGLLQLYEPDSGTVTDFPLGAAYDRFVLREDPPLVGAFYSDSAEGGEDTLFLNKGEVAFVDVTAKKDAIHKVVLPTYGGSPLGVDIADRVPSGGGGRLFAFIRWHSYVSVVDVEKADIKPTAVPLKAGDSVTEVYPGNMKFVVGDGRLTAFFLAQGASDLHAIDVDVDAFQGEGTGVSLKLFPTAPGAQHIAMYQRAEGDTELLVLCPGSNQVATVRPETSGVTIHALNLSPRNVELFRMPSPETGKEESFAFIFDDSGQSAAYYFVELDRLEEKKSKAFHFYVLPDVVRKVYALGADTFLVMHPSGGSSPMSRVTAADGAIVSVGGNVSVTHEVFSADGTTMYALASKQGTTRLVAYDAVGFQSSSIDVTHGRAPTGLAQIPEAALLLLYDANGETLVVVPEAFKSSLDAVEFLAPFLYGLEH